MMEQEHRIVASLAGMCSYRLDTRSLAIDGPLGLVELANTRPAPDTWSILEYVDHVRQAYAIWRARTEVRVVGTHHATGVEDRDRRALVLHAPHEEVGLGLRLAVRALRRGDGPADRKP